MDRIGLGVRFMVLNATFNNISVKSWRSVLLVEETGVPAENLSQFTYKLHHIALYRVHRAMSGKDRIGFPIPALSQNPGLSEKKLLSIICQIICIYISFFNMINDYDQKFKKQRCIIKYRNNASFNTEVV